MDEPLFVIVWIILAFGVVLSLSVSIGLSRQFGRLVGSVMPDGAEVTPPGHGLPEGISFPDASFRLLDGTEVRPSSWDDALIVQVVVSDDDIDQFKSFNQMLPGDLESRTIVSTIGRIEAIRELPKIIEPAMVLYDSDLHVEALLRTKYRPHAVYLRHGRVRGSRTIARQEELIDFAHTKYNEEREPTGDDQARHMAASHD